MTLGSVIVLSGFAYACSCRLSNSTTETGILKGRQLALICLILGITVEAITTSTGAL